MTDKAKPRTIILVVILTIVTAGATTVWHYWLNAPEQGEAENEIRSPPTVTVASAKSATIRETVSAVGTLQAEESVNLTPELRGRVKTVSFQEGKLVEQGQVLVRPDDDKVHAQLATARAIREEAHRQFERARSLDTGKVISAAEIEPVRLPLEVEKDHGYCFLCDSGQIIGQGLIQLG